MTALELIGGRYRLVERLGDGGTSVVWRAHDGVLGRHVAVKLLAAPHASDAASRSRIRTEARAVARLSHPNVTRVYDYGESRTSDGDTVPYVVMELLTGQSLVESLVDGPMPWPAALEVGAQVAAALAAAHASGLVHRDIKPANVVLTETGAKVIDFGLAAPTDDGSQARDDGTLVGTPAYLAPERLAGRPALPAADVYAFGVLLCRLLTGGLPWPAQTTMQMLAAHTSARPRPLPPIEGLPTVVADLYLRCLAKSPDARPSASELERTLSAVVGTNATPGSEPMVHGPSSLSVRPAGPDDERPGNERPENKRPEDEPAEYIPAEDVPAERVPAERVPAAGARSRRGRVRVLQVVGAAVVVAVAGLALSTRTGLPGTGGTPDEAVAAGQGGFAQGGRAGPACHVRYQVRSDSAGAFRVDLAISNTSGHPLNGWTLEFAFPGDQAVVNGSEVEWSQHGSHVTGRNTAGNPTIKAGATVAVGLAGTYRKGNPAPTTFVLDGETCAFTTVAKDGQTQTGGPAAKPEAGTGAPVPSPSTPGGGGSAGTGSPNGPTASVTSRPRPLPSTITRTSPYPPPAA